MIVRAVGHRPAQRLPSRWKRTPDGFNDRPQGNRIQRLSGALASPCIDPLDRVSSIESARPTIRRQLMAAPFEEKMPELSSGWPPALQATTSELKPNAGSALLHPLIIEALDRTLAFEREPHQSKLRDRAL